MRKKETNRTWNSIADPGSGMDTRVRDNKIKRGEYRRNRCDTVLHHAADVSQVKLIEALFCLGQETEAQLDEDRLDGELKKSCAHYSDVVERPHRRVAGPSIGTSVWLARARGSHDCLGHLAITSEVGFLSPTDSAVDLNSLASAPQICGTRWCVKSASLIAVRL